MHQKEDNSTHGRVTQRNEAGVKTDGLNRQSDSQIDHLPPTIAERFKELFYTAILGSIFLAIGIYLLFWNEARAISLNLLVDEALEDVERIVNTTEIPLEYEGKLVHFSGEVWVSQPLTDPAHGIAVESILLERVEKVYQWVESKKINISEVEIHEYKNHDYMIERRYMCDGMQIVMTIRHYIQIAAETGIGNITFGYDIKKKFNDFIEVTDGQQVGRSEKGVHTNLSHHSHNPRNLKGGEVGTAFFYAGRAGEIYSILGKLENGVISSYVTSRGEKILIQRKGKSTVDEMIHYEQLEDTLEIFLNRFLGCFLLYTASNCLADILKTKISKSSFLYHIMLDGSSPLSVSVTVSLWIIASSWIWYQPILALCLLLITISRFLYSKCLVYYKQQNQQKDQKRSFPIEVIHL